MLRTALLVLSGNAFASFLLLIRNLVIARLLPVEDYGIAATFAVAMAIVEMASDFGLKQQIVQSKEGDDPHFQDALQGFQVLRGVGSSLAMLLLAPVLAGFLGIPQVVHAYQILAIVPLLNALVHFDIHRLNRHMKFGPLLFSQAVPALVALGAVWPLVMLFGDWRVMLWSIVGQAMMSVVVSHILAERPFRLILDRKVMAGSLKFGWPLLVNAILLFLVFQGDKLIVGRLLGLEALAIFSMLLTLTLTPTMVLMKSLQGMFLPLLAKKSGAEFRDVANSYMEIVPLLAALFVGGTAVLGPTLVLVVLGPKYAALVPIIVVGAVGQAIRFIKTGPAVLALSRGNAENAMYANVVRVLMMPLGWFVLRQGGGLYDLLLVMAFAELVGFVVGLVLVRQIRAYGSANVWCGLFATCGAAVFFGPLVVALVLGCTLWVGRRSFERVRAIRT